MAWNIDGTALQKINSTGINFSKDLRIPEEFQCGAELYSDNRLDRGHAARTDLLWGCRAEAGRANKDSFFFTNITPQIEDFNQSSQNGVWGRIEDAVFAAVEVQDMEVSVFVVRYSSTMTASTATSCCPGKTAKSSPSLTTGS